MIKEMEIIEIRAEKIQSLKENVVSKSVLNHDVCRINMTKNRAMELS